MCLTTIARLQALPPQKMIHLTANTTFTPISPPSVRAVRNGAERGQRRATQSADRIVMVEND